MTIKFKDIKKKLFEDPRFVNFYERIQPEFALTATLIEACIKAKLSQKEISKKMKTIQSAVAQLESGDHFPSFKSLQKYAQYYPYLYTILTTH